MISSKDPRAKQFSTFERGDVSRLNDRGVK